MDRIYPNPPGSGMKQLAPVGLKSWIVPLSMTSVSEMSPSARASIDGAPQFTGGTVGAGGYLVAVHCFSDDRLISRRWRLEYHDFASGSANNRVIASSIQPLCQSWLRFGPSRYSCGMASFSSKA